MTPLAQAILADYALPVKGRQFADDAGLCAELLKAHPFDMTAAFDMMVDLSKKLGGSMDDNFAFLPAPSTWIEWKDNLTSTSRMGFLLQEEDARDGSVARVTPACRKSDCFETLPFQFWLPLRGHPHLQQKVGRFCTAPEVDREAIKHALASLFVWLQAALVMINTPRIIGRRQHMPHRGLEQKLARARGMVGRFPLQAWTEIILEVTPPKVDNGEPHEAHLTGRKALHFCRQHLRIRNGSLELVRSHWRGDPALGMKRSRYIVTPPKGRAA